MNPIVAIEPKQLSYTADCLVIRPGQLGPPPTISYTLGKFVKGTSMVPESNIGKPTHVPFQAATDDRMDLIQEGTITLTPSEWSGWDNKADDYVYLLKIVCARLNITLKTP